ncbi:MAG TPA: neutral/alkaline non-lysosomal ceramidase N-terminal domain-containing protein [Candidatus Sumerlaeota bacterium]|nr:neutral/alkaline non-lysosomal ceramidase N-terminal domain-containing protein [Candidatus Sumerlaeota bacterium]
MPRAQPITPHEPPSPRPARRGLRAGAAQTEITPRRPMFLFGYPHVERTSTGVNDPLLASALYLETGGGRLLLLSVDLCCVTREITERVRAGLRDAAGLAPGEIVLGATHTHSGPVTASLQVCRDDAVVPAPDAQYVGEVIEQTIAAGRRAVHSAVAAECILARADARGIGGNRHDPAGPCDPEAPVLALRARDGGDWIGLHVVHAMHPTVLHEDSRLVSADYPGQARRLLKDRLGAGLVVVHHMGAGGNQSPRHFVRGNTLAEARRLGEALGTAVLAALERGQTVAQPVLSVRACRLNEPLARRAIPARAAAHAALAAARARLAALRADGADPAILRTAECDVFGAEEVMTLVASARSGSLDAAIAAICPPEIQCFTLDGVAYTAWPGEFSVEYALELRRRAPNTYLITNAGTHLEGYIVTEEEFQAACYEANCAVFSPEAGRQLLAATVELLHCPTPGMTGVATD